MNEERSLEVMKSGRLSELELSVSWRDWNGNNFDWIILSKKVDSNKLVFQAVFQLTWTDWTGLDEWRKIFGSYEVWKPQWVEETEMKTISMK